MNNLFLMLKESTEKYPEKVFVIDKNIQWTYSDIYNKAISLANRMYSFGISAGDRVLIYLDNTAEYITAFFSAALINAIIVPINKNTTMDNLKYIIKDTTPKGIISNSIFLKRLSNNFEFENCIKMPIDSLCDLSEDTSGSLTAKLCDDSYLPALILYTSGTTKMPKGVTLTHKNLISNTESTIQYLELAAKDSIVATINFCYSYGNSLLLTHTYVGGTIIIENRVSYPIKVIEQLHMTKATGFSTVGSYINLMLKQDELKSYHLENLKYITFAGESTSFEDISRLSGMAPHLKIFVMYGQTEAAPRLSYLEPSMLFKKSGSIGKGMPGVTLRVVTDEGRDVIPNEIGEIIAYGNNIMKGYWNNEEATKSVIKSGWLYTGDLATVDEDGYIYVKGRKDDIIKYLGHRISPAELEAVINSHDQVLESAVIGFNNGEEKQIKAFIVPKVKTYNMEDINLYIKKCLPPYKRPQIIEFINELPRTSNGKIKRSALRNIL